jgi:hypothetical protein
MNTIRNRIMIYSILFATTFIVVAPIGCSIGLLTLMLPITTSSLEAKMHNTNEIEKLRNQINRICVIESEQPTTHAEMHDRTKHLRIAVPSQYQYFLMLCNGGHPKLSGYSFVENGIMTSSDVAWFQSVHDGSYENLVDKFTAFDGRIPERYFPIARDSGGNLICISASGSDDGYVYFFNKDMEGEGERGFHMLAKSFSDFLCMLHE